MKYVFGINITENENNNLIDGEIFCSNTITPALMENFCKCDDLVKNYEKHTSLPGWMNMMKYLSFLMTCLISCGIMQDLSDDSSLGEVYANAPEFFFVAAAFFIVWLVLYLVERKRKYQYRDEFNRAKNYILNVQIYAKDLLQIPDNAVKMEVLSFLYKINKEKMEVITRSNLGYITHKNTPVYVYVKDITLHMADLYNEWSIPLCAITGIKKINERIFISQWNKEITYNKGEYKKYKIARASGLGYLYFKPYYALCITWHDENYELFIPPYELDVLSSLVGINYDRLCRNC